MATDTAPITEHGVATLPEQAWERAHAFYLQLFAERGFSDIQEQHPKQLVELECAC